MTAPVADVTPDVLVLAGRRFLPVGEETDAEHDSWMLGQLSAAGLHGVVMARARGVPAHELPDVAFDAIVPSGRAFELVAGCVVEEGKGEWSIAAAEANARFFRKLKRPEDKQRLFGCVGEVLRGFFGLAERSSATFPSSSKEETDNPAGGDGNAMPSAPAPDGPAAAGTSAPGTASSGSAPTGTSTGS